MGDPLGEHDVPRRRLIGLDVDFLLQGRCAEDREEQEEGMGVPLGKVATIPAPSPMDNARVRP